MNMLKLGLVAVTLLLSANANAALINFESDGSGAVANGFVSNDLSGVSFSDTMGANLSIANFAAQGDGLALAVNGDDASRLQIDFSSAYDFISIEFGNDDPGFSMAGDLAWLQVLNNGVEVGLNSVLLNRDDILNQTISFGGQVFNQAIFYYGDALGAAINLIEIVDNINVTQVSAVPVPAAAWLFGSALLGLFGFARRKA